MKFMADSCSNFNLPAVDGDVSISTPTYKGKLLFCSLLKESICCGTLSSSTKKSPCESPDTNWPFLSVTVIGKRTRRVVTVTFSWPDSADGKGEGDGFCAFAGCPEAT